MQKAGSSFVFDAPAGSPAGCPPPLVLVVLLPALERILQPSLTSRSIWASFVPFPSDGGLSDRPVRALVLLISSSRREFMPCLLLPSLFPWDRCWLVFAGGSAAGGRLVSGR
jgi:hypothetical protein